VCAYSFRSIITGELSDSDVKSIMDAHFLESQEALGKFDKTKEKQMADLIQKKADERGNRENRLRQKHEQEAKNAGLPLPPIG